MNDFESYYDSMIESEDSEIDVLQYITNNSPEDSLCSAADPDGNIVSICGSSTLYTSPEAVFFVLIAALAQNKNSTVKEVLYSLSLDLKYQKKENV